MFRKRLIGFLLAFSMIMTEMRPTALAVTASVETDREFAVTELAPVEKTIKETDGKTENVEPEEIIKEAFQSKLEKINTSNDGLNMHAIVTDPSATDWFTWVYPENNEFTPDEMLVPKNGNYQWHHNAVDSFTAWGSTKGSKDVVVAIIGGGIDPVTADIDGDFKEFYINGNSEIGADEYTTALTNIIAGDLNGKGGAGIAPDVTVHSYNVKDENGDIYTESFAEGVKKAVGDKVDIIFMQECSPYRNNALEKAVTDAYNAGIPVIVPAGYIGSNVKMYPAAYEGVISITGTNANGYRISDSSYGDWITISAPGQDIFVSNGDCYVGAEAAAAVVTGAVALYMSVAEDEFDSSADIDSLKELLVKTGTKPASKNIPAIVNTAKMLESIIPVPRIEVVIGGETVDNLNDAIAVPEDKDSYLKFVDVNEGLNYVIAYTLDGKTPKIAKGVPAKGTEIYDPTKPIDLKEIGEGKLTVTAVAYNKYGKNSVVMKQVLTLTAEGEEGAGVDITGPEGVVIGQKATFTADFKGVKDTWVWSVVDENGVKVPGAKITNKGVLTLGKKTDVDNVRIVITGKKTGLSGKTDLIKVYQPTVKVEATISGMTPDAKGVYTIDSSETEQLTISYKLFDSKGEISAELVEKVYGTIWKSSSAKIAEVSENGVVTIKNKGSVKITVTANDGSKKSAVVSLKISQPVKDIEINAPVKTDDGKFNVAIGTKVKFTADVFPGGADNKTVEFYLGERDNTAYADGLKAQGITMATNGTLSVSPKGEYPSEVIVTAYAKGPTVNNQIVKDTVTVKIVDEKATAVTADVDDGYSFVTKDKIGNVKTITVYTAPQLNNKVNLTVAASNGTPVKVVSAKEDIIKVVNGTELAECGKAGKSTITVTALDGSNKSIKINVTVANGVGEFKLTNGADAYGTESLILAEGNKYAFKYIANDFAGKKFSGKLNWKAEWADGNETLEITDYVTMKNGTLTAAKDLGDVDGKKVKVTMEPVYKVPGAENTAVTYVTLRSGVAKKIEITPATINSPVKAGDEAGIVKLYYKVLNASGEQLKWIPAIDWTVSNKKAAQIVEITDEYVLVENLGTPGKVTVNAKATNGSKATGKANINFVNRITDFNFDCKQVNILKGGKATIKVVDIQTQTGAKPTINKFEWSVQDAKTGTPLTKADGVTVNNGKVTIAKTFDMDIEGIAVVAKTLDGSELEKIHILNFVQPMDDIYVGIVKDPMNILASYKTDITVKSDEEAAMLEENGIITVNEKTGLITNINLFTVDIPESQFDMTGFGDIKESRFELEASGVEGDSEKFIGGDFIWTSSNEKIVSVETCLNGSDYEDGRFVTLVGRTVGTAKITCEAADGSGKKVTFNVKVTVPVSDMQLTHTGETTPWWSSREWSNGGATEVIVASGKSVKFTAKAGDTFGKPTNSKIEWTVVDPLDYDADGELVEREEKIEYTFKNGTLNIAKANKEEGWLCVEAKSTDGTERVAVCDVYVVPSMATFIDPVVDAQLYKKTGDEYVAVDELDVMTEDVITAEPETEGLSFKFITDNTAGAFTAVSSDADVANVIDIAFRMYGEGEGAECLRYVKRGDEYYPVQTVIVDTGVAEGRAKITLTTTDGSKKSMSFNVVSKEPAGLERFIGRWFGNSYVGTTNGNDIYETMEVVVKDIKTVVIDGVEYAAEEIENTIYSDYSYDDGESAKVKDVVRLKQQGAQIMDFVSYKTSWDDYFAELHIWKYGYNSNKQNYIVVPLEDGEFFVPSEFIGSWFTRIKQDSGNVQIKITLDEGTGEYFIRENGAYNLQSEFEWSYFNNEGAEGIIITDGDNIYEMEAVMDPVVEANYLRITHNGADRNFKRAEGYYGAAELGVAEDDLYGFWYNDITDGFYLEKGTAGPNKIYTGFGEFNWEYNIGTITIWAVENGKTVSYGDMIVGTHIDSAGRDYISLIWEWTNNLYVPQKYFVPTELVDEWTGEIPGENGNEFESLILTSDNTVEIPEQMFVGAYIYRTDKKFNTDNRFIDIYGDEGELYRTYTVVDTDNGISLKYKNVLLISEGTGGRTGVSSKLFEGSWTGKSPVDPIDKNTVYNEIILTFFEDGTGLLVKGDDVHGATGETFLWNYELNREENINRLILTDANGNKEGIFDIVTTVDGRMTLVYEGVIDQDDSEGYFYEITFASDAAYAVTEVFVQNSETVEQTDAEEIDTDIIEEPAEDKAVDETPAEGTEIISDEVEIVESETNSETEITEEIQFITTDIPEIQE